MERENESTRERTLGNRYEINIKKRMGDGRRINMQKTSGKKVRINRQKTKRKTARSNKKETAERKTTRSNKKEVGEKSTRRNKPPKMVGNTIRINNNEAGGKDNATKQRRDAWEARTRARGNTHHEMYKDLTQKVVSGSPNCVSRSGNDSMAMCPTG